MRIFYRRLHFKLLSLNISDFLTATLPGRPRGRRLTKDEKMQVLASFTESFKICGHLDQVALTTNQKVKLAKAFQDKSPITLHLSKGEIIDGDDLMLTKT